MDWVKVVRNEQYLVVAGGILDSARRSVDIATYKFEFSNNSEARGLNYLIGTLGMLAAAGIRIRILLNRTGRRSGLTRINENAGRILQKRKIQVRFLADGRCQHAKIILVDKCSGIIGSHNWSPRSMVSNFEVSVAVFHAGYLKDIQEHFEKIWESSQLL